MTLAVCCWLWRDGFRDYRAEHVNLLQRMAARRCPVPHRFYCITDERDGFAPEVTVVATPPAALALDCYRNPGGPTFPSCYRRLWMFSPEAEALGERLLLLDVDLVMTADLGPLLLREEDFVGYHPQAVYGHGPDRWAGGLYLLRAGSRRGVWNDFQGQDSIRQARRAGYHGSDQAWISYRLGPTEAAWGEEAGIFSIFDFRPAHLPEGARVVQFNGGLKPWQADLPWVDAAYSEAASADEISRARRGS